jgi:aspartate racemase
MSDRRLGVLGGMGPAATADFFAKLVKLTPAHRDQQHIATVICSVPQIPDRTKAILEGGPSPLPAMLSALTLLERCGCNFIAIPCNTAHYWFDELQRQATVPIVHIVDAAVRAVRMKQGDACAVGLLATTATVQAGIYSRRLEQLGIECLVPGTKEQASVMAIIRAIKGGTLDSRVADQLQDMAAELAARGATSVILGCSELPLAMPRDVSNVFYVDATEALATECVRMFEVGGTFDAATRGSIEKAVDKCRILL